MTTQSSSSSHGWVVTIAATGINLILGSLYAWGVIGKSLVVNQHWTKTQAALPFTASTACFAFTMIFAGRWQDKMGPRVVALLGGIVFAVGLLCSSFATTPLQMFVAYGLVGGIGIGLCYSATTPPAVKWFPPSQKGLIMGIVVSGVGLAAVYASPLMNFLLGKFGISQTFVYAAACAGILISLFSIALRNPPPEYAPVASASKTAGPKPAPVAKRDYEWKEVLKMGSFYQLWFMLALSASAGLMLIAQVATIAKDQAKSEWGFMAVALLAIFNTAGRLVGGYVSDRIGRTNTLMAAFILQAVNMFCFPLYTDMNTLMFGTAATGICYGAIFPLFPAAVADFYGVKNLGVNYGLVFTGFGVAGVLGPILGSKLCDVSGSWNLSFFASAFQLLVAAKP
jgi:OFA family oxalate/formate antiporter-like MFS transporter